MRKVMFLLFLIAPLLCISCEKNISDDVETPGNTDNPEDSDFDKIGIQDYLDGNVVPRKLVSNIVQMKEGDLFPTGEWEFKYDDMNRLSELHSLIGMDPYHNTFSYKENKIFEKASSYGVNFLYELNSDGYVFSASREPDEYGDLIRNFEYENQYMTYISAEHYMDYERLNLWKNGDLLQTQQVEDNMPDRSIYYEYGKLVNNPYINVDFNIFLDSNFENKHKNSFSENIFKAFECFGKRSKHYKIKETTSDDAPVLIYDYLFDKEGYVAKIIETAKEKGFENEEEYIHKYIYTISYVDAM